jgi:hypothetical protein
MSTPQPSVGVPGPSPNASSDADSSHNIHSDKEKQMPLPTSSINHLVEWDGDSDPLDPRSMPVLRKWLILSVVAMGTLLV